MSQEEQEQVLSREERAQAVLEVIEEIKPPSMLKWHIIFFLTGTGAGAGIVALLKLVMR